MSDTTINRFVASGTAAQRVAFTPAPATPASGPNPLCIWYETDTGDTYISANAAAWVLLTGNALNVLPWKRPCRAKTTGALAANTYANGTAGVGATLTANGNGALAAQDGITLVAGERLLVANEVAGLGNGIYTVTQVGTGGTPYILTRATDANNGTGLVNATVKISEGTAAADQEWQCTTNAAITVGTTAQVWAQAGSGGGSGSITASGYTQNTAKLLGRTTAASGAIEEIAVSGGLTLSGGSLSSSFALITETVTSGSAASVTFSSIAATYRDLIIIVRGRSSTVAATDSVIIQFNSDTTSGNYLYENIQGSNATLSSGATTSAAFVYAGEIAAASATASFPGLSEVCVFDYRGTTFFKNTITKSGAQGNTTLITQQLWGAWKSTAAITSVKVFLNGAGGFVDNSVVSLYGRM